jgi:hypothetical protein
VDVLPYKSRRIFTFDLTFASAFLLFQTLHSFINRMRVNGSSLLTQRSATSAVVLASLKWVDALVLIRFVLICGSSCI